MKFTYIVVSLSLLGCTETSVNPPANNTEQVGSPGAGAAGDSSQGGTSSAGSAGSPAGSAGQVSSGSAGISAAGQGGEAGQAGANAAGQNGQSGEGGAAQGGQAGSPGEGGKGGGKDPSVVCETLPIQLASCETCDYLKGSYTDLTMDCTLHGIVGCVPKALHSGTELVYSSVLLDEAGVVIACYRSPTVVEADMPGWTAPSANHREQCKKMFGDNLKFCNP
ncbi:MAG: hypothetical protein MUF64_18560 [Polyangiaceae bacterium]|nr:hypothetical protein [Polyangiaceae bacterium]